MNIIFLDIDGPLIPLRMYYRSDRMFDRNAGSFVYDPIAVDMINVLCDKFQAKVVFNSSHGENPQDIMRYQGTFNKLLYLHDDCATIFPKCERRFDAIGEWFTRNPITNPDDSWIVIDDIEVFLPRQVLVDLRIGLTMDNFYRACELFGEPMQQVVYVGHR